MSINKNKTEKLSSDEVIHKINEVLVKASGESIETVARMAGLRVVYLGDSMFEIREK